MKTLSETIQYLGSNPKLMPVVLGPTACGKTKFAVSLAKALGSENHTPTESHTATPTPLSTQKAEIISADSRQIYRGMDIGSGKDLEDYQDVPYHLIDIAEAGEQYNIFLYQKAFDKAYREICERGNRPILCGGSGMYLTAALSSKNLVEVPVDTALREAFAETSLEDLADKLRELKDQSDSPNLHNISDIENKERCFRAIEIAQYEITHKDELKRNVPQNYIIYLDIDPQELKNRIKIRLKSRFEEGMIGEVEKLLADGLKAEQLLYYGLEYRYITEYLIGKISSKEELFDTLYMEICRFAKRQRTWFRGMERKGFVLHHLYLD